MPKIPLRTHAGQAIAAATLLLLAAGASAGAQSREQRLNISAFRDSIGNGRDTFTLKALERDLIAAARDQRSEPMVHLRLGFLSLRLADIGGRGHYEDAGSEFQWVVDLQPRWPYGWYGLGLAEYGVGDSDMPLVQGLQTMLGKDALTRAANAFAKSAEVDPEFVDGLVELANTALEQRINSRTDVALTALRRAAGTSAGSHPAVMLARGQIERGVGSLDSARSALDALLRIEPRNARALLEMARVRFAQGRLDGGDPWYRGLAIADAGTMAEYLTDIGPILPDSVFRKLEVATLGERVSILRGFWMMRDNDELHRPGERLREHYRRLDHARRNFSLVTPNRQFDIAERYRSGQTEFDDRGIIYIRHGAPDERAAYNIPGIEPNETWRYGRDGDAQVFHFVARQDVQDFRLVESVFDLLGFAATVALRDGTDSLLQSDRVNGLLRSRESIDPIYSRLLGAGRGGSAQLQAAERKFGRLSIAEGTSSDSWRPHFADALPARIESVAVGQDGAGPSLQLAFAVPGSALRGKPTPGGFVYLVRMRAVVLAADGRMVASIDTTRAFMTNREVPAREHLLGHTALRVPAGDLSVRVALETEDAGMVTSRDPIRVAGTSGPSIALSDLAVGSRTVQLPWVTASGDTAWANPLATFPRALPLQLYFEVTGVARGTPYRIDITMARASSGSLFKRVFGGKGAAIKVGFEGTHPGGIAAVARTLSLAEIKPGDYVLEVTVTDQEGHASTRQRNISVAK
ncbi:MAG: tetratricopeptide repeat protein [Gemmatimonadales bacterium]